MSASAIMPSSLDSRFFGLEPCYENQTREQRTEVANKIVEICKEYILSNDKRLVFQKTRLGVTGMTFLCSISGEVLRECKIKEIDLPQLLKGGNHKASLLDQGINVLLKYVKRDFAYNERFCAEFLKKFGFETPDLFICDKVEECDIRGSTLGDDCSIVFMYAFPGASIGSLVDTMALFQLSESDYQKVLCDIGKIVIFDLLIANDDRFFRYDFNHPEKISKFVNPGNIMFHLKPAGDLKRTWETTYYIDNTTKIQLCPPKSVDPESASAFSLEGVLFASQDEELEWGDEDSIEANPIHVNPIDLDRFSQAFAYYTDESHHGELAQVVAEGIRDYLINFLQEDREGQELSEEEVLQLFLTMEFLKSALEEGFKKGIKLLEEQTFNQDDFIREMKQIIGAQNSFCQKTINLMHLSLKMPQQSCKNHCLENKDSESKDTSMKTCPSYPEPHLPIGSQALSVQPEHEVLDKRIAIPFVQNLSQALNYANSDMIDLSLWRWKNMSADEKDCIPPPITSFLELLSQQPERLKYRYAAQHK